MRNPTWRIVTMGYLNHNKFRDRYGQARPPLCTTTLIETEEKRILVDPGCDEPDALAGMLDRRSGLKPDDIDMVFLTHFDVDHWAGIVLFPKALWLMSKTEIRWWNTKDTLDDKARNILAGFVPVEEHPVEGIEAMPTYGHSHGHTSLVFETREGMVIVAGDAVLSFEHFDDREPAEDCEDEKAAKRAIDQIAKRADLIIPGHDNYFVV